MKKWFTPSLAAVLALALLTSGASAYVPHLHPLEEPSKPSVSGWAEEEIARAGELGLLPQADFTSGDCTQPIDRDGFLTLAVNYVAQQNNCDLGPFNDLMKLEKAERDDEGHLINPFTDEGSYYGVAAYYLGIAQGDETGALGAKRNISRQEAAAMLFRAYQACGGKRPEEAAQLAFADQEDIQSWAREDVAAVSAWGVMKGDELGRFDPDGLCTVEQAVVMFLRLYEGAPVSRVKGNVEPLFTYEQCLAQIRHWGWGGMDDSLEEWASIGMSVEGKTVTFLRQDVGGIMQPPVNYYLVFRAGGIRQVNLGLCDRYPYTPRLTVEEGRFSEDETAFICKVTLAEDTTRTLADGEEEVLHEKGVYQVTVDVATAVGQAEKQ